MRREPGGPEGYSYYRTTLSMQVRLVELSLGTAPNPLTWKASVSLLILTPQNLGKSIGSLRVSIRHLPLFQKSFRDDWDSNPTSELPPQKPL